MIPQLFMLTSMIPIVNPYKAIVTDRVENEFDKPINERDTPNDTAPTAVDTLLPT